MNHDLLHVFVGLRRNDLIPYISQYSGIMKRYLNSVKVSWDLSLCYPRIPNNVALIRRIFDSQIVRFRIRYNSTLPSSKYSSGDDTALNSVCNVRIWHATVRRGGSTVLFAVISCRRHPCRREALVLEAHCEIKRSAKIYVLGCVTRLWAQLASHETCRKKT